MESFQIGVPSRILESVLCPTHHSPSEIDLLQDNSMQSAPALQPPSLDVTNGTSTPSAGGPETAPSFTESISQSWAKLQQGELTDASWELIIKVVVPAVAALALLIVAYFVAAYASRVVARLICNRVDKTLGKFGGKFTFYTIMTLSVISILQFLEIGVTSFAAVLAATGFAVGLAFQGTLSNFAAGVLLLVFRPFRVGDVVNTAGVLGKVNAIDLFTTTFDTPDNRRLIVPNSAITGATIENVTFHPERRVEVVVGVDYSASLDTTRQVLTECAEALADCTIQGEGRGYQIVLANLGASSVDWKVRLWTKTEDFFAVQEELTEEIKNRLDEVGIGIPFPQMELHLAESGSAASVPPAAAAPVESSIRPSEAAESTIVAATVDPRAFGQTSAAAAPIQRMDEAHLTSENTSGLKPPAGTRSRIRPRARSNRS
ncbi:MAG: mechanosensitive ion channel domain-containing protein [Planctomycetota bacterium]